MKTKKKRKNRGKQFEKIIQESVVPSTFCYRLRDSSGAWSTGDKTRFTPTNYCDFFIFFDSSLYLLEAKTTKGKSIPFGNIKKSQIDGFKKINGQYDGVKGVFAIEFSEIKETYFIAAECIIDYIENTTTRKSVPIQFIKDKGIEVEIQRGKRTKLKVEEGLNKLDKK